MALPGWSGTTARNPVSPPVFHGAAKKVFAQYRGGVSPFDVVLVHYAGGQRQGGELASSENSIVDLDAWRVGNTQALPVILDDGSEVMINESVVRNRTSRRLIWYWYDIDGEHANSNVEAKLLEAKGVILRNRLRSSAIIVAMDLPGDVETYRESMREFVSEAYGPVRECLGNSPGSGCSLGTDRRGAE